MIENCYNLYEISKDDILHELDRFEDVPNYYERHTIKVKIYDGTIKKADAYFMKKHKIPKNKEPLAEWIEQKNNFLFEFEKYYKQLEISEVDLLANDLTIPSCPDASECMHKKLKKYHLEKIKNTSSEIQIEFMKMIKPKIGKK